MASVYGPGVRGGSGDEGRVRGQEVSVHRRLLGGRVVGRTDQSLGGGDVAVLQVGDAGGRWWTHLGLKHREEEEMRNNNLIIDSHNLTL